MKKPLIIVLVVIVLLAVGAWLYFGSSGSSYTETVSTSTPSAETSTVSTPPSSTGTAPTSSPVTTGPKTFTLAQVALHANASSCYSAINGSVYDLTKWIDQHPGGPQRILAICGTDGSAAFNGQHGGQARPASELAGFKIGVLVK